MKNKKVSIIIITAIWFVSFFMQSSLYNSIISFFALRYDMKDSYAFLVYALPQIAFWIALISSMLVAFKPYLNIKSGMKIFAALILIILIEFFITISFSVALVLIGEVVNPLVIIGLYFWVTKSKPKKDKKTIALSIATVGAVILRIVTMYIDHIITVSQINMMDNTFFDYLSLLHGPIEIFAEVSLFAKYCAICLLLICIVLSIPDNAKPVRFKKWQETEVIEEEDEEIKIPDGMWRCMGCGEILPFDIIECECGYKRKV